MICCAIIGEKGKVDVDAIVAAAKGGGEKSGVSESRVRSRESGVGSSNEKQKLHNQQQAISNR